jgi:flagellin
MAMFINTNVPSLTAQRYLGQTNNAVAKSLEKLSSGLRINNAADDASGLAISEKLRGQISGLKRASLNAQDGISLLQTAEGGLQNIQNMLQRMRELSVQAGNGVYTTNDRAEIQKEVDQLKSEINRIASSTEFNTKKLLNGDATALWSSDSSKLNAIVKGAVAEGNYNLEVTVDPGKNNVYKTDVMTLNEGAIGAEIVSSANATNVASVGNPTSLSATNDTNIKVTIGDGSGNTTSGIKTLGAYLQAGSQFNTSVTIDATSAGKSGYVSIEALANSSAGATNGSFKVSFISAKTGDKVEATVAANIDATGNLVLDASGSIDGLGEITIAMGGDAKVQNGDKILYSVSGESLNTDVTSAGGGTVQVGTDGPVISYSGSSGAGAFDSADMLTFEDKGNDVTVHIAEIDSTTGNINVGSITLNFAESGDDNDATDGNIGTTKTGDFEIKIAGGGEAATSTTKLKDVARFTTSDGRNIFDNVQELKVFGNGTSATIFLEGDDTIADFETKLTDAIVSLGMGATPETSKESTTVNNNLVNYVAPGQGTDLSNEALEGTFIIQSARLGEDSKLSFIGDQNLINGLSLANIQKGENSQTTVTVTDAHNGKLIGKDKVSDGTLRGVIQGVDVKIDSDVGVDVSWNSDKKEFTFAASGETENIKLHLVDNAMEMQIGANEGQSILANIPQVNTTSLGIDDVLMVDQELAQKSITKLDRALENVSGIRATIGAQINRLEYTMAGLDTTRENLTAAESRIRDLDIADEMAKFTKNQILAQANISMLAQANSMPQLALSLIG